jgi:hypothetical protein
MPPRITTFGNSRFTIGVRAGIERALGVDDLDEVR